MRNGKSEKNENNGSIVYHTQSLYYELNYEKMLKPGIKSTNKTLVQSPKNGSVGLGDGCQVQYNSQSPHGGRKEQAPTIVL